MLVLETHSLRTTDASFAESLYGLRRRAVNIRLKMKDQADNRKKIMPLESSADAVPHSGIDKRQKVLSVVFLVNFPFFWTLLFHH